MSADEFQNYSTGLDSPARAAEALTASDTVDVGYSTRAIYVGGGGDLKVVMAGGQTVTFTAVPAGALLPIRVSRVLATGTTATALVGLR